MVNGPVSFSGLVSGLNTQSIINAEMAVYEQPLTNLQTEQSTINTKIADYQAINTQLLSLQQSADALAYPSAFNEAYAAATSNSSIATASVTSGTQTGSLTFAVDQLAVGSTQISAGHGGVPQRHRHVRHGPRRVRRCRARHHVDRRGYRPGRRQPHHRRHPVVLRGDRVRDARAWLPVRRSARRTTNSTWWSTARRRVSRWPPGTYTPSQLAQAVDAGLGGQPHGVGLRVRGSSRSPRRSRDLPRRCRSPGDRPCPRWGSRPVRRWPAPTASISVDGTSTTVSDISGSGTTSVVLNSGTGGTVTVGISGGLDRGLHDGGQRLGRRRLSALGGLGHQQCRCRCHRQRTPGRDEQLRPGADVQRHGHRLVDHHRRPGVRRLRARGPPDHDGGAERRGVRGRHGGISGDLPDQRPRRASCPASPSTWSR